MTQTTTQNQNQTKPGRRTQKDLRYLADGKFLGHEGGDAKRNSRIRDHGWIDGNASYTEQGDALAYVTRCLISRGRFDAVLGTIGLPDYVDVIDKYGVVDALSLFAGALAVRAVLDDVLDQQNADTGTIAYFGFRNPSSGRVRDRITIRENRYAGTSVIRAFEIEASDRGYDVERHPDDRTRNGRSKYVTTVKVER